MESSQPACPVCNGTQIVQTVERSRLPAMQNRVYRSQEEALAATAGRLCLRVCSSCGFAFNQTFDRQRLRYDQDYDNRVPSTVAADYYRQIAQYLKKKYLPHGGLVVDIGCGKGTLLKTLCSLFSDVRGLGIDPSYEGPERDSVSNLRFVSDFFDQSYMTEHPRVVVCRHVLEHIEQPISFLKSIRAALQGDVPVHVFFEVPDLEWTVRHRAFWDFCYEHCNYFTSSSLAAAMELSGFRPVKSRVAFGDQYLWIEAVTGDVTAPQSSVHRGGEFTRDIAAYSDNEKSLIARARHKLSALKQNGRQIAVWGMATKGVLYCCLIDPQRNLFDCCIDVNRNKQGCFVPTTGHRIDPPDVLRQSVGRMLTIVVMNPNYLGEIRATCYELGLTPEFLDANGEVVSSM